ncbi:urea transporter [Bacteroidota bacterium]
MKIDMRGITKENIHHFTSSIFNSYSQVFFSTHRPFSVLIIIVSFFDVYAGLSGFIAVLTTSLAAFLLNFDRSTIAKGFYGFNSLLVGLGIGIYFSFSWYLLFILILASLFTFFVSVLMQGVIGKYNLPYLSIPFLFALWTFMLATKNFDALGISERGIYTLNELYSVGGNFLVRIHEQIQSIELPNVFRVYFISLSAILFQYSLLSGFIIAIGLLLYSRIAFSLSLIGFFVAYLFYYLIGANITVIDYSYIGFNYILTAIALGGFFLIPSLRAYLWMIVLIPLVAILTISLNYIFIEFKLPVYSLPFNIIVLLFIYILKFRSDYSYTLTEVYFQHNSPEKNLYIFQNNKERFRYKLFTQIKLPFYGTWDVSQGHNGEHTHKNEWKHAWDFVILNNKESQFKNNGDFTEDYFCFGKPVIAPEEGVVEKVVNNIDDNVIGEVNLNSNWGNTIIIKHDDEVYSKMSHLKKDSIKVTEGEKVKYGQIIGECGNSGRSPYPHLHFQIQEYPYIGSGTKDYPISAYVKTENNAYSFLSHKCPQKDEKVSNIEANELLSRAYRFIPGEILKFEVEGYKNIKTVSWEVKVNPYNETYLQCSRSQSIAYYESDDHQFYFTYFEGPRDCLLYYFFLGSYKIQEGFYQDLELKDRYPLYLTYPKMIRWLHDFISPFGLLIKSEYTLHYSAIDDYMSPGQITLNSNMKNYFRKRIINGKEFNISLDREGIKEFTSVFSDERIVLKRWEE